jgi:hypothetical protein
MTANQHNSTSSTPTSIDKEGKYQYVRVSTAYQWLSGSHISALCFLPAAAHAACIAQPPAEAAAP